MERLVKPEQFGLLFSKPRTQLKSDQWYPAKFTKKFIFLHHTAGGDVNGAISWWNKEPDHVCTPYIIDRAGVIYELFDPSLWAYALGVQGATAMERASIHIELVAWGSLSKRNDKFFSYAKEEVPADQVWKSPDSDGWRGAFYYQNYTKAQLDSLGKLLTYLRARFNIPIQDNIKNFWFLRKPENIFTLNPGIWSHTTVRKDKSDIIPQKELIDLIYSLPK